MLSVEVSLSYSEQVTEPRVVAGWYLPCTDTSSWLRALQEIGIQARTTKFYLAPTDAKDVNASGLIAISEPSSTNQKQTRPTPIVPRGAIPLVILATTSRARLFLPSYGKLSPWCDLDIKKQLEISRTSVFVWLPQSGLIGFEPEDEIQPALLIKPSTDANRSLEWMAPLTPPHIPDRLPQISITSSMEMQQLFVQEREQIGGDSDKLLDINEQGEPQKKNLPSKVRDAARQIAAKYFTKAPNAKQTASGAASKQPAQKAGPNAGQSGKAADSVFGNISRYLNNFFNESLQAERDRQIEKLLRLMARNPDLALKYSIPMGGASGGGVGRGISSPGSKLSQHNVDFSLSNVAGGGRAVDPWNIRDDLRKRLLDSYREQARREIAAGRHRRAAYIYAHLLGDFAYAATILEQGKFYAEAATLYGKHLNRPRDQARCLVSAAQFPAAAAIYEELGDHIAAGDLWSKIAELEKAKDAYEKAIDAALGRSDIIAAAKLMDEKLHQRERAEQLLWQQWPYGAQTFDATALAFRWLGETNRHSEALERFQTTIDLANNNTFNTLLARFCAHLSCNYPLESLKIRAEDQCRLCISDGLDGASKQERENRMEILRSLHPHDPFLQRDSRRFLDQRNRVALPSSIQVKSTNSVLTPLTTLSITAAAYIDAIMIGTEVLAIGWRAHQLIASRAPCNLDDGYTGQFVAFANTSKALATNAQVIFNRNANEPQAIVNFFGTEVGFPSQKIGSSHTSTPWSLTESPFPRMLKAAYTDNQQLWTLAADLHSITTYQNGTPLTCDLFSAINELVEKDIVSGLEAAPNPQQVHICCVGSQPFVAIGNLLLTVKNMQASLVHIFDSPITYLSSSLPHSLPRLLISTSNDLRCYFLESQKLEFLTQGASYTEAIFLHGGRVVALSESNLELYERNAHGYQLRTTEDIRSRASCRLLPISVDVFGLLMLDGTILRWKHR